MTHFLLWAAVTVGLLGVALAFGFAAAGLGGARERRDARRRARDANVWRLLEGSPGFNEGMAQAQEQADRGEFTPYRNRR